MINSWHDLYEAGAEINVDKPIEGVRFLINAIREAWYEKLPDNDKERVRKIAEKTNVEVPDGYRSSVPHSISLDDIAVQWSLPGFHDRIRFHIPRSRRDEKISQTEKVEVLRKLYDEQEISIDNPTLDGILAQKDISILPLNLVLPNAIRYFLPTDSSEHIRDPFGVKRREHIVTIEKEGKEFYLATNKPGYVTFLVMFGKGKSIYCPHGCADCYRGLETREGKAFEIIEPDGSTSTGYFLPALEQIKELVKISGRDSRYNHVYDILLSGGEPLQETNDVLKAILGEIQAAENITSYRICTGSLFIGKATRFDNGLVSMLADYRKNTGNDLSIAAHISHPEMITPESIYAAMKLRDSGIEVQAQIPMIDGINVFLEDLRNMNAGSPEEIKMHYQKALEKSYAVMSDLMRKIKFVTGARPYKWLNDTEGSVPVEFGAMLWEIWRQHLGESDVTRATSYARFHSETNIDLSMPVILNSDYSIAGDSVVIRVPQGGKTYELRQKIFPGVNYPIGSMHEFYEKALGSSNIFHDIAAKM